MAGLHRSPLICLCFQDLLATFGNVEDSFSPLIIQALSNNIRASCKRIEQLKIARASNIAYLIDIEELETGKGLN